MRRFAKKKFTLTCSHRPIFISFVSVTAFLVALEALHCSLLFSKCSAKNYRLSLILTGQYQHLFPGCQPSSKFPTKFNQHKRVMIQRAQATSMSGIGLKATVEPRVTQPEMRLFGQATRGPF